MVEEGTNSPSLVVSFGRTVYSICGVGIFHTE